MLQEMSLQDSMREWVAMSLASNGAVASDADQDSRPIVLYRSVPGFPIKVGGCAFITPVDHYNTKMVSNKTEALTSYVLTYDKTTEAFETKNTRYVLDTSLLH